MKKDRIMKKRSIFIVAVLLCMFPAGLMAGGQSEKDTQIETTQDLKDYAGATELPSGDDTGDGSTGVKEEGTTTLTAERAVEIAMNNNLQLKSSLIDTRIKERKADYAWNRFVPSVQASGTLGRMNTDQSFSSLKGWPVNGGTPYPGVGTVYQDVLEVSGDLPQWSVSAGLDMSL